MSEYQRLSPELVLRHWQMIYHLGWEYYNNSWPYADRPKYPRDRYGFLQLFEFAKRDPRFAAEGLVWKQPPCAWYYGGYRGIEAQAHFLGQHVGLGHRGHVGLNKWLEQDTKDGPRKGGPLIVWLERQVIAAMKEVDEWCRIKPDQVPRTFDFMDPALYPDKLVPTDLSEFD